MNLAVVAKDRLKAGAALPCPRGGMGLWNAEESLANPGRSLAASLVEERGEGVEQAAGLAEGHVAL